MNNFLYLSGLSFYVFVSLLFLMLIFIFLFGSKFLNLINENRNLTRENRELKNDLYDISEKYYKATFKVPEID